MTTHQQWEASHPGESCGVESCDEDHPRHAAPDPAPLDACPHCEPEHVWPCPTIPRCDEPGCKGMATSGWPSDAGYRRTCGGHYAKEQQP